MRSGAAVLALALASCSRSETAPPPFALRPVAAPAIAELESRVEPVPVPPAPSETTRARVRDAVALAAGGGRFRSAAASDVAACGAEAIPALAATVGDDTTPRPHRLAAAELLAAQESPAAASALLDVLEASREAWLRAEIAALLGRSSHPESVLRLIRRLSYEQDGDVVLALAGALAHMSNFAGLKGALVVRDTWTDEALRDRASQALNGWATDAGYDDPESLRDAWLSGAFESAKPAPDPPDRLRLEAWRWIGGLREWDLRGVDERRFVLSRLNEWIVPMLASALHDSDPYVRVHAAQCLERAGARARAAAGELRASLGEPRLAPEAAAALAAIGAKDAAPDLEAAVERGADGDLRIASTRGLGLIGRDASIAVLDRAFSESEPLDLRQAAAESLLALGRADRNLGFLVDCLEGRGSDPGTAEAALERWLERALSVQASKAALERWRSLAAPTGTIPTADEVSRRRSARAAIVRESLSVVAGPAKR